MDHEDITGASNGRHSGGAPGSSDPARWTPKLVVDWAPSTGRSGPVPDYRLQPGGRAPYDPRQWLTAMPPYEQRPEAVPIPTQTLPWAGAEPGFIPGAIP